MIVPFQSVKVVSSPKRVRKVSLHEWLTLVEAVRYGLVAELGFLTLLELFIKAEGSRDYMNK